MIYLDTSVVVAFYCPEAISPRAEAIVRGKVPIFISDLTEVEFASALARKVRIRDIAPEDAAAVRSHFTAHLEGGVYRRTSLGTHHIRSARELLSGMRAPLRTLDALHLAIVAAERLRLITADRLFASAARALSIEATYISAR